MIPDKNKIFNDFQYEVQASLIKKALDNIEVSNQILERHSIQRPDNPSFINKLNIKVSNEDKSPVKKDSI